MKYLTTNQNFHKSEVSLFHVYNGWHEFNFLKRCIYVNKATLLIFDIFIKFNYFIGTNVLQIVFHFITCSVATIPFLTKELLTCSD